jgi:tricorn protease
MQNRVLLTGVSTLLVIAGFAIRKPAIAQSDHDGSGLPMLHEPAISASDIAFVYADDIWIAPRHGEVARRLVKRPGARTTPRFSPDGSMLAFRGTLDGQEAIYTADVTSGAEKQNTHAPGNTNLCGWTADNHIVYLTSAFAPWFDWHVRQLYSVPAAGGLPHAFPLAFAGEGAVSPDGRYLAYANYGIGLEQWKHYQGGYAPDIWLQDLNTGASKRITTWKGFDSTPMWHGTNLYYVSDEGSEQRRNLWRYDLQTGKHRQLTAFADFDITSASIGPGESGGGEIIFEHGARIGLLDLRSTRITELKIPLPEDTAPKTEQVDFSRYIANWQIDPSGKRAVVEARGDLWLLSGEGAPAANLTKSPETAERSPAWSHDGTRIAYFSDASGEYQLQIMDIAKGATWTATKLGKGYPEAPVWSPEDARIAFYESSGATHVHTLSTAATATVAHNRWGLEHRLDYSWSPDGKWLAYVLDDRNGNSSIWLYEAGTGESHRITSGAFRDREPVFDPSGGYLYFLSTRDFSDLQYDRLDYLSFIARRPDVVMAAPLRNDIALPWNRRQEQNGQSSAIEFEGLERRSVRVPGANGYLSHLSAVEGGRLVVSNSSPGESTSVLVLHVRPPAPAETIRTSGDYRVAGGRTLFEWTAEGVRELAVAEPRMIRFAGMTDKVEVKAEWAQIFRDAWRFARDFFADPEMHGTNWPEIRKRYEPWVSRCATRNDLNFVIREMAGELGSSHTNIGSPGTVQESPHVDVGMLGVDYVLNRGAYQIAKIYEGAAWDMDARNPLRRPGITVGVGDYILRVNGKQVDPAQDPWAAFVGLANQPVRLTVSSQPAVDEQAREVVVVPVRSETILRNRAWIEANREAVLKATDGRAGYLYIPDTYFFGTKELLRQLGGQMDKEALIVDARWNEGGLMPDRLIESINRPQFYTGQRQFSLRSTALVTNTAAPKCLLTNAISESGGDSLALYFQRERIGPVIGTRTMGAGGGSGGPTPGFVDGGRLEIRWVGTFDAAGGPGIEGRGVTPDIAVEDAPGALYSGNDRQLRTAIDVMNRALAAGPGVRRPVR